MSERTLKEWEHVVDESDSGWFWRPLLELAQSQAVTLERVRAEVRGWHNDATHARSFTTMCRIEVALGPARAQSFKERFGLPEPAPAKRACVCRAEIVGGACLCPAPAQAEPDDVQKHWDAVYARMNAAEARCAELQRMLDVCSEVHGHNVKLKARVAELEADVRSAHRSHADAVNAANARCAELELQLTNYRPVTTPGQAAVLRAMAGVDKNDLEWVVDGARMGGRDGLPNAAKAELARRESEK